MEIAFVDKLRHQKQDKTGKQHKTEKNKTNNHVNTIIIV